jgi:hypothetical protein
VSRLRRPFLSDRFFFVTARLPAGDRKWIRPSEKIPLELNDHEGELILKHSFADEEITGCLRIVPPPNEPPVYRFTLDDQE